MSGSIYNGPGGPGRRAGVVAIEIDGEAIDVAGDATYYPNKVKREPLIGQSGPQGYSEMPEVPFIAFRARDAFSMSVETFMSKTNSQVNMILANGKTVFGSGMFCTEASEVSTMEATFNLKFMGGDVTESST